MAVLAVVSVVAGVRGLKDHTEAHKKPVGVQRNSTSHALIAFP